jgi:hypothetical protein
MIVIYLIEVLLVMFNRSFNAMNDIRSNDILELFGGYAGIFLFDDGIQFLK